MENISVEELVNNEDRSTELLETVSDSLINVMRHRSVNGIFVILNTDDLDEREIDSFMPVFTSEIRIRQRLHRKKIMIYCWNVLL